MPEACFTHGYSVRLSVAKPLHDVSSSQGKEACGRRTGGLAYRQERCEYSSIAVVK